MNNNGAWLVTIIITLPSLCSKGEQDITTNGKNDSKKFLDDVILKNSRSDTEPTLHLSARRSILMAVQSSLKTKVSWKSKYLRVTAPQITEDVELREAGSSWSIQLPSLSVKDTSRSVSSKKAPTAGDLTLSVSKDYTEENFAHGSKNTHVPRNLENRERHKWVHEKLGHFIPWKTPAKSEYLNKSKLYFDQRLSFLNRLKSVSNDEIGDTNDAESVISDATVESQQITKRHIHSFEDGFSRQVLKREAPAEKYNIDSSSNRMHMKSTVIKDIAEKNGTASDESYQTAQGTHPATIKPEGEEFLPGMTKSVFITVTSSSLMITLCVAVVSLYYIRRRRIRMAMDPERQRLIPFKAYTGIYYNQTGLCF